MPHPAVALTQRSDMQKLLQTHGFTLKKGLGQNFLVDHRVLAQIVDSVGATPADGILEIGPGAGVLTQALAARSKKVIAVEKDTTLAPILRETVGHLDNVAIRFADFLDLDLPALWQIDFADCERVFVVANLPYYITTPILFHLLDANVAVREIVVMVQKEVAQRLMATPGGKEYGVLTVMVRMRAGVEKVVLVPPGSFIPPPTVDSMVIRLRCYEEPPVDISNQADFRRIVKAAFGTRRKTLQNALCGNLSISKDHAQQLLMTANIDAMRRAETLTLSEFASLSNVFTAALHGD